MNYRIRKNIKICQKGTYCKVSIITLFLKFAHFEEIEILQFLTNFTEITVVSHIVKLHFYNAPLWKAEKICNY